MQNFSEKPQARRARNEIKNTPHREKVFFPLNWRQRETWRDEMEVNLHNSVAVDTFVFVGLLRRYYYENA